MIAIADNDRASMAGLAIALQWTTKDGKPYKARVQRAADRLKKDKLVTVERRNLTLTSKGKTEAKRTRTNIEMAGATY